MAAASTTISHLKLLLPKPHFTFSHSKPSCLSLSFTHKHISLTSRNSNFLPIQILPFVSEQQTGEQIETEELVTQNVDEFEGNVSQDFAEPPEDNLPNDFDSEKPAQFFNQAGVTENVEEIETDELVTENADEFETNNVSEFAEPPEEAKLYVGNLPYEFDSEKLAQFFNQAGVVEIAEVIYNRQTDQSRGFGFITMSTVEEADKAVEMFSGYDLNGRLLTVDKAAPRGSQPERVVRTYEPSFRVYVGNLSFKVDNAKLEQVFSDYGKVVDARVVYDRESGRSRGFGFVTMSSEKEIKAAIAALDGQDLDRRAIRVNVAEQKPRRGSF